MIETLFQRRDLLLKRIQQSTIPTTSHWQYLKTIDQMFEVLKKCIDPQSCVIEEQRFGSDEISRSQGNHSTRLIPSSIG
jgi:hypothetical protein